MGRLPEQSIKPMDSVLAPTAVAQGASRGIRETERVIKFAHHQETAIRTEPGAPELQPHPAAKSTRSPRPEPAPFG